jgi:hypothetical protein
MVTFITPPDTETAGLKISLNPYNSIPDADGDFGYYRGITIVAPPEATEAIISFTLSSVSPLVSVDDVSFSLN